MAKDILPKDLAGFKLSKDAPAVFFDRELGDVDLRSVTVEKAQQLVDAGCTYIQKTGKGSTPEA